MPHRHVVREGECLASIAFRYGFSPDTLWSAPENQDLRKTRANPNVLRSGDVVFVPDKRVRREECVTDARHVFRRKSVPDRLRLRFALLGQPRKLEPYEIEVDGRLISGIEARTDGDGAIEHSIAPDAKIAVVRFPQTGEEFVFHLGHLDPVDTIAGVKGRLRSLGYYSGAIDDTASEELREAVARFQVQAGQAATGELDDAGRQALMDAYGG